MQHKKLLALILTGLLTLGLLSACGSTQGVTQEAEPQPEETAVNAGAESVADVDDGVLRIARQGVFAAGGTVTEPVEGEYNRR